MPQLLTNAPNSANKDGSLTGALSEPVASAYFGNIQVFDIAKEEDGPLFSSDMASPSLPRPREPDHFTTAPLFRRKTAVWPFPHFVARDKTGFFFRN
jgi:hypothetical protein